ncbi:MAG: hypothetical protein NVS3B2_15770 [Ramlibacter sp.]
MPTPIVSETELATFLKRAGFSLTPEQLGEYYEAYGYVEAMAARLRSERSHMAEPAHIFSIPMEDEQ